MVEVAWKQFSEVDPKRNYLVSVTYSERQSAWSFFHFLFQGMKVSRQSKTLKGFVGFSARLEFLGRKTIRIAVFEDESALKAFANSGQHAICQETSNRKSYIKWKKRARWTIPGSEIPLKIDDAVNRILSQKEEMTINN